MKKYGCIGKKLSHSFSKEIHAKLAPYSYELIELREDELETFFAEKNFEAINVTIPYKQAVIPFLDHISDIARRIGAVNTVVNRCGKLYGYNTDYFGMKSLVERVGISLQNKKVLILGTGGTSKTARVLAEDMEASEILTVSRQSSAGSITYNDAVTAHSDAEIIINTTPVGMYPDCDSAPIELSRFDRLCGVIDAVYNPLRTNLVLDAQELGIRAEGGLYMLVMQAVAAVEKFLDVKIERSVADSVFAEILLSKENIVLIGMPGCGKTTVSKCLKLDSFELIDTDRKLEESCSCTIKELISARGEKYFRDLESDAVRDAASSQCRIISTGGGAILRKENVKRLKQNGRLFFIDAKLSRLRATGDRPLSSTKEKLEKLYSERIEIYRASADVTVPDMETPDAESEYILSKRMELIK